MFERYTEKARRVIFFARYEASQFGSPYIETEHLLLGLLREDNALAYRILRSAATVGSIREQIEGHSPMHGKVFTALDLPLSHESKRVLAYGAEESKRMNHKHIGTPHLLLGLLREEKCFAADLLRERGLQLELLRKEVMQSSPDMLETRTPGDEPPPALIQLLLGWEELGGIKVNRRQAYSRLRGLRGRHRRNHLWRHPGGLASATSLDSRGRDRAPETPDQVQ